jgi:transcriptional regulator of arginine metabolism
MNDSRANRLNVIRDIIRGQNIRTQMELMEALEQHGLSCTQGTLSRDSNEIGLRKLSSGRYSLPEDIHLVHMLQEFCLSICTAENQLVLKTTSGTAQGVAAALDATWLPLALGTIAGDDTILIITKSAPDALELADMLADFKHNR